LKTVPGLLFIISKTFFQSINFRILYMKCYNQNRAKEWSFAISNILREKIGKEFNNANQRFMSYSPIRENSMVKWLVDGADYMESIAEAIELAQEEIFIASFFLSPELYLKRPVIHGNYYRLDYLLKRKAVSILIILMSFNKN
jgi:phospholipase D1/2